MGLNRPYNISLNGKTIDGNETNIVTWDISGDIQTAYEIDIYLNDDTNYLVWSSLKVNSYNLQATLPIPIANEVEHKIIITAYNKDNVSAVSYPVVFQTSSRPIVTVDSVGTVASYANNFTANYSQSENVPMQSYLANLYNANKELIDHSDILIDSPLEYLFSNLETDNSYYIEFQATSEKGLIGTSGLIKFNVFYLRPKTGVSLTATNIDNAGIELSWFVTQILGESNGMVGYINNDEVSLINDKYVYFDSGFKIEKDFSLKVWLRNVESNVPLITLKGDNGQIVVKYSAVQESFILTKTTEVLSDNFQSNSTTEYTFVSPYQIVDMSGDKVVLLIQQIGSDINLTCSTYN